MSKILAIGDVHTKTWIIEEVAKLVNDYDQIVFCGDYADDWDASAMRSLETWRILKELMDSHDNVKAVIGNHDYAYIYPEIAGRSSGFNPTTFTLLRVPETKYLLDWLLSLPVLIQLDGITFSHAGVTEAWNGGLDVNDLWNDASPIWARPMAWGGMSRYKEIPQVIGHNPGKTIWNPQKGIWCVDTFSKLSRNSAGDYTVLEIDNGKYEKIKLRNSSSSGIKNNVS
jgi:hypothetical protein